MNTLNITCADKFNKALEESQKHRDNTLQGCITRLVSYSLWGDDYRVNVYPDCGEHCFYFEVRCGDNSLSMNGGLIFHGWPEEGYRENLSVQLTQSYGWSIHT